MKKILIVILLSLFSFNVFSEVNLKDIGLIQKQYDWQFSDTKGRDTVIKIVKRDVGGMVAITAKNQYFLIYKWDEIKSKVPKGIDSGPYGILLMAVTKEVLSGK